MTSWSCDKQNLIFLFLYCWIHLTWCEKEIKCSASLPFYLFSPTCLINSIKHEHWWKILFLMVLWDCKMEQQNSQCEYRHPIKHTRGFFCMCEPDDGLTFYSIITPFKYYVFENIMEMEHLLHWSKCSIFHNIFKSFQKIAYRVKGSLPSIIATLLLLANEFATVKLVLTLYPIYYISNIASFSINSSNFQIFLKKIFFTFQYWKM